MSEPVSALSGVVFSDGIAEVAEADLQGMITLRGDLAAEPLQTALAAMISGGVPETGTVNISKDRAVAWMSPDELLLMVPYDTAASMLEQIQRDLGDSHTLAVNVSDARAAFKVSGARAREVLGKLCPVDFSPAGFVTGMFRRTRLAQVPAAVWLCREDCLQVVCFRSHARYVFDVLTVAAQEGSSVDIY